MHEIKPIYEYIQSNLSEGKLDESFSLAPYDNSAYGVDFADGALDGISIYHMGFPEVEDAAVEAIKQALTAAVQGDCESADQAFQTIVDKYRTIDIIEQVQNTVVDLSASYKLRPLFDYATGLLQASIDPELVKLGLAIHEVFGEQEETPKDIIRTLGACNEFTLYSAKNARNWTDGNNEVFKLAQATDGWGRIHCLEMVEPETEQIRQWILHEGINNTVMSEYSALTCLFKANVPEMLASPLSQEDFAAVSAIFEAATEDSSPVETLLYVEGAQELLALYLQRAAEMTLDLKAAHCLHTIALATEEEEGWGSIFAECRQLLEREDVVKAITDNMASKNGIGLARALGYAYEEPLLAAAQSNFDELAPYCTLLMDEPRYLDAVLELYNGNIPPSSIEDNPQVQSEPFDIPSNYNNLEFLLGNLSGHMPKGLDFVLKALTAPPASTRSIALSTLNDWACREEKPLSQLSAEAVEQLQYASEKEPSEELRERMLALLGFDGKASAEQA